nr:hypothetical protein [Tanacetum cinerariifolium]
PALYNGHEIIKENHIQAIVHNSEDTLEIADITRKKRNDKMNDPEYVTHKSNDLIKIKSEALKERTKTKACYLQEVILFFKTLKDNFEGIQKALTKEVKEIKDVFEELEAEVVQHDVVRKYDAIELKNLLIANDSLIDECLSQEVFCMATNSELNIARFTDMHVANTTAETHSLALEVEFANLRETNNQDNQTELITYFSKLEVNHLNLQLKYQDLKDQIKNSPPTPDKDTPDFDSVFVIGKMQAFLQGKDNVIRQLKKELSQAENDKIKQHYKELYDSIKITRAKHIEQVTKLTTENINLKTGVSKATVNSLVSARDKHAIDVEPIVPRLRNNRNAHLDYLRHLKESVETIRDIVEEAKVTRPLDRSIVSAYRYTKHSQELLEYMIGTCPHGSQPRAKQLAHIPLIRKKQVIVTQPSNKVDSATHPHMVTVTSQKINIPVPPSIGVDCCPIARGSQPMSHVKPNRISPAKDRMDDVNAPFDQTPTIAPPARADDQILPNIRWIPTRKSNCYLDLEKSQSNPIYKITVDLLKNTDRSLTGNEVLNKPRHVTSKRSSRLLNFMKKFIGTVRFGNDDFGAIMGYGDYVVGESVISRVYYVEGLSHNLFSVGQFCDSDLEVAFKKHSCFVRDTNGVDLIKGSRGTNLYTISVEDMMNTINDLARKDLVRGLPRLKFEKDYLCSACQLGKSKKHTHKPKAKNTNLEVLNTLHMDLCGPMRVQTINGKKYILVIVNDYSRFTWVKFLRSKDETLEVVIKFITQIQVGLRPAPTFLTPGQISSGRVPNPVPATPYAPPTNKELEILLQPMFDEYLEPPRAERPDSPAQAVQVLVSSAGTPLSTTIDYISPSSSALQSHSLPPGSVAEPHFMEDYIVAPVDNNPFVNIFAPEPHSEASSLGDINFTESPYVSQTLYHLNK